MPARQSTAPHGTVARYKKHQRDFAKSGSYLDKACDECTEANRIDGQKRRDGRPAHLADQARKRAESRALRRLQKTFLIEYHAFYTEELAKEPDANGSWTSK